MDNLYYGNRGVNTGDAVMLRADLPSGPSQAGAAPRSPSPWVSDREIEDFLSVYETVSYHDSEVLVGVKATEQLLATCAYCWSLDERGVPEWAGVDWARLCRTVFAGWEVSR